jgi:hypothetical protein
MPKCYCTILLALLLQPAMAQDVESPTESGQPSEATADSNADTALDAEPVSGSETVTGTGWMTSSFYWLEEQRNLLAKRVTSTAVIMDEYIARDSFDDTLVNESYLRIRVTQPFSTGYDYDPRVRVRARVDVPNSEEKVKLFLDTDPEEFDSIDDRRRGNQDGGSFESGDAVVGISFFQKARSTWNPNLSIGISTSPTEIYTKVRVQRYDELPGPWQSRFNESLTYYDSRGWVSSTRYDAYRPLDNRGIFRISSEAQFNQEEENPRLTEGEPPPKEDFWEFYHGWSLYRQLDDDTSIEYSVAGTALSRPSPRMENIWVNAEWRQLLYKDWLFGKITPEISFPRERDFTPTYAIFFELEIYIGEHFRSGKYEDL